MNKKIYLFIGPQRSGTTSVYTHFKDNSNISTPSEKENNLLIKKTPELDEYLTLFEKNKEIYIDVCPQYFGNKLSFNFICARQHWFEKIIFIHRNPLERAESFLKLQVAYGRDIKALEDEIINNNHFICAHRLQEFKKELGDKLEIWSFDNLEVNIQADFNTNNKLTKVHSSFGKPRFNFFNKYFLPLSTSFLRGIGANNFVDIIKENKLVRKILFKQPSFNEGISYYLTKYKDQLLEENKVVRRIGVR